MSPSSTHLFFLAAAAHPSVFMFLKLKPLWGSLCVPPVCKRTQPLSPRPEVTLPGAPQWPQAVQVGGSQDGLTILARLGGAQNHRGHLPTTAPSSPSFSSLPSSLSLLLSLRHLQLLSVYGRQKCLHFPQTHLHIHILGKAPLLSENRRGEHLLLSMLLPTVFCS